MLRVFEDMFGDNFWKKAVLLLTHCSMDEKTKGKRREATGKTDPELAEEYIENLRKWFPKCDGLSMLFMTALMKVKQLTLNKLSRNSPHARGGSKGPNKQSQ